jgi:DHA1 family bicyclomycin/chloramphenicol resistance-like MFS transporter
VLWMIVAPVFLALSCQGFTNGNVTAGALGRHAAHAGSAAALMGVASVRPGRNERPAGGTADGRHAARDGAADVLRGRLCAVVADLFRPKA